MADSKIPVEIEVRLDERSVGVSMDALKAKVKTQGREIGKSLSGAFSDISFMSDAVMKAEREKDKFLKKQLDADRAFNNSVRGEAKKTSDSQLALIKQQEAAMWASYEVEKSGKKALEDHKVSLAKKAAAEQLALIKQQEAAMWASYEVEKSGKKALEDHKVSLAKKAAAEQLALIKQQEAAMWASYEVEKSGKKALEDHKVSLAKKAAAEQLALIKQQEAAMWASYEVEKSGKKALEDYKVSLAKKAAAEQAAASMFVGPRLPKSFSRDNLMQGVVTGNQDAIRTMAKLHEEGNKMNAVFGKTATLWGHIEGRLRGVALLTTELTRAFFGLSLAVAAVGAPAIFGTRYLKNIEDAKMGLIGTLVTMGKFTEGTDKFQAALGLANDTIKSLEVNALRFGIPLDEILNVFRAITASGLQAGMTLEQIGKSAAIGTVAVRALGLDARQSVQELRDLFMGGIMPASSTLATSLGLRDSDIKKAKADAKAGIKDFYDFIMEQLQGYELVAAERTNTLSGSMDLLGMKLQRLFANEGIFTSIKDAVKGVSNSIAELDKNTNQLKFNPQLMDQLYQYNAIISKVVGWMGSLAEATLNNINHVVAFISSIALAATTMGKWGILTILVGWLKGIGAAYTAASTRATAYSLAHSAAMTKVVATTKGVQAATLAAVGKTGLIGLAFFALYEAADMMGLLDGIFGRFEQRVDQARQKVKQMTTFEKQERLSVVEQNLKTLGAKSAEGYDPYSLFNDFKQAAKKAAVSKETGKIILEEEYNQLRDWQKAEYGQLESIETLMRVMNAEREGIVEEIQKAMKPASVKVGAGGVGAFMKGSDALLKGSDFEKRREAESKMNSLLLQMQQGAVELDELYKKRINSNDLEKLNDREEQAKEIRSRIQAMADERRKIEESMNKSEKIKVDPSIARAQKDALTTENIFAEKQDTLVREGAKTYIEAYNDKIAKIKEFAEKNGESIKWEERRNEAYKTVSDYLTQHNAQLNKESEQREANTTATLKYGAAVETSGAALLMEQYAREGFLNSGFKELALSNVLAQSRNDLSKIHEKSVKEQIDSQKELDELVAESSLMFLENEKQKSEFKMQETLKRINAEREEAKKSLELNLKLRMNAGPLSPQEYENYLKTKEAIDKSFMDREETTRKIFNQRVKNAELKDAKETVDKIEGTFKEAFMNIAESGTSGWRSMLNKFKSDFKKNIIEYIYKELAKPFVLNVIAQVTGAMGMSGVSQAATKMAEASGGGGSDGASSLMNIGSSFLKYGSTAGEIGASAYNLATVGNISGVAGANTFATAAEVAKANTILSTGSAEAGALAGAKASAAGASTGASMAATAASTLAYVYAAYVALDALGAFGKRGGPQQGQYGELGANGYKSSFTMSGGDAMGNERLSQSAMAQAKALYDIAGRSTNNLTLQQGYKLDPQGSSAGLAYRNLIVDGKTLTGGTFDGNNGAQWMGVKDDAQGAAAFLASLTSSEIEAIAKSLNDSKLNGIIANLKKDFRDLSEGMARYQTAQALQKGLLSAVLTSEEAQKKKLADATELLNSAMAGIGKTAPQTTEEFRALVTGIDITTKAGQDLLGNLAAMGDAFTIVAEAAKAAAEQHKELENRLAVLRGEKTDQQLAREKELQGALTDSNRAMLEQIYAMQDQAEAAKAAADSLSAAAATTRSMSLQLLQAQGNATAAQAMQREQAMQQILSVQPKSAAEAVQIGMNANLQNEIWKAEDAAKERALQIQLLQARGDTAGATAMQREDSLNALTSDSQRDLMRQIYAAQDLAEAQKAAAAAAAEAQRAQEAAAAAAQRAAEEQARAQQAIKDGWQRTADAIIKTVQGFQDTLLGEQQSFAKAQADFSIAAAAANAGDQKAATSLPELAKALVELGKTQYATGVDQALLTARTSAQLREVVFGIRDKFGIDVPAFASGGAFGGGLRLVGENGPELEVTGASYIHNASNTRSLLGGANDRMVGELQMLREENARLREVLETRLQRIERNTQTTSDAVNGANNAPILVQVA